MSWLRYRVDSEAGGGSGPLHQLPCAPVWPETPLLFSMLMRRGTVPAARTWLLSTGRRAARSIIGSRARSGELEP